MSSCIASSHLAVIFDYKTEYLSRCIRYRDASDIQQHLPLRHILSFIRTDGGAISTIGIKGAPLQHMHGLSAEHP